MCLEVAGLNFIEAEGAAYDHELAVKSVYEHSGPLAKLMPDTWFCNNDRRL